ncbi:hypothetical protein K402DRAFT_321447 [Aulographum hederae CBS 113979]|uniref:Uncharacterized protein n=1 Tax=Aulographum hederae CBS 113979 TaxID=1176131 RepID=A0A6G1HFU1_9PEZI|nr:hypothetical protein K402DRAFT_321447 [Aulographum hederae CBS 113979]
MQLNLCKPLHELVQAKYKAAKDTGALMFSPTELTVIQTGEIPFQLRYCPALAKKPTQPSSPSNAPPPNPSPTPASQSSPNRKFDPFENPIPALHITNIPAPRKSSSEKEPIQNDEPSHLLVLNKFPVIPSHFIIATKANRPQTHLLEVADLAATYACLRAWDSNGVAGRLYAFFNSGEHSGASQPHRHLQFLPVESMREGSEGWETLIDVVMKEVEAISGGANPLKTLPFSHFASSIPPFATASEIHNIYLTLHAAAISAVRTYLDDHPEVQSSLALHDSADGSSPISYNLGMTTSGMVICPRRSEDVVLKETGGKEVGTVALNGTILAGTLMVKAVEEWNVLREVEGTGLEEVLVGVGIPRG